MTQSTDRLALPLLFAGQAQKEVTHNEALVRSDILIQASVEGAPLATPPTAPQAGECWIVATGATGVWSGKSTYIACWTAGGWIFLAPQPGWRVLRLDEMQMLYFDGADWSEGEVRAASVHIGNHQVVGEQQAAISAPSGGSVMDAEARIAITAVIQALRNHGLIAS